MNQCIDDMHQSSPNLGLVPRAYRLFRLLSLSIGLIGISVSAFAQDQTFVLITHRDSPINDVSKKALERVFLIKSDSIGKVRIKPINFKDEDLRFAFLNRLTGKSKRYLQHHFLGYELRDGAMPPGEVESLAALIKYLLKTSTDQKRFPLAWVTIDDFEKIPEVAKEFLKTVAVDGKNHQDSAYPLSP